MTCTLLGMQLAMVVAEAENKVEVAAERSMAGVEVVEHRLVWLVEGRILCSMPQDRSPYIQCCKVMDR